MESGVCVMIMSGVSFSSLKLRWPSIALNSHWCQFVYQSLIRAIIIAIIMDNKRSNLVELDKYWCKWEFSSNKLCEKILYIKWRFWVEQFFCWILCLCKVHSSSLFILSLANVYTYCFISAFFVILLPS